MGVAGEDEKEYKGKVVIFSLMFDCWARLLAFI
jgi:hypothetical protein